jgi:hypothetical protein
MQHLAQSTWWRLYGVYQSYDKWKKERPDPSTRGRTERDSFNASVGEGGKGPARCTRHRGQCDRVTRWVLKAIIVVPDFALRIGSITRPD